MARTIFELETNKNAVIFWYSCPYPAIGQRPYGCVVQYMGYSISASIFDHKFSVFKNSENLHKEFVTLRDAKNFVCNLVNTRHPLTLFPCV